MNLLAEQMAIVAVGCAVVLPLIFGPSIPGRTAPKRRHAVFWLAILAGAGAITAATYIWGGIH
jgi:hypothetical protein